MWLRHFSPQEVESVFCRLDSGLASWLASTNTTWQKWHRSYGFCLKGFIALLAHSWNAPSKNAVLRPPHCKKVQGGYVERPHRVRSMCPGWQPICHQGAATCKMPGEISRRITQATHRVVRKKIYCWIIKHRNEYRRSSNKVLSFVQHRFIITLVRCCRNLTLMYIN